MGLCQGFLLGVLEVSRLRDAFFRLAELASVSVLPQEALILSALPLQSLSSVPERTS